jgi:hypothetical protein
MSRAGRTTLTKVTLSAILVHVSIVVMVHPWVHNAIDKIRRAFIWTGSNSVVGGRCMVAWAKVTWPTELGLGVVDLAMMCYALWLCSDWLARVAMDCAWSATH